MSLVVIVAVIGLQAVGMILIIALMIIPAAAARLWTERLVGDGRGVRDLRRRQRVDRRGAVGDHSGRADGRPHRPRGGRGVRRQASLLTAWRARVRAPAQAHGGAA